MFLALSLSYVVFIMLINVKMSTIVGILTFMSRINFVLSLVEHWKSFIALVSNCHCYLTHYSTIASFDTFEISCTVLENIMENGAFALWEQMLHFP